MSEVYKIGVAILLTDGMSPVLSKISHALLGVHKSAKEIEGTFNKWRMAAAGAAGIFAGSTLLHGLAKVANHGKELLDQQDKLIRAGRTHAEVANLTAKAYEQITKSVPTSTAADVLRVANELTLVKGDFQDAINATAASLKLEALMGNATGKKGEGEGYNLWRSLELKNVTMDHARTDKLMGGMLQAMIASGGKITGLDYLSTARQGGVAWTNLSDDFMTGGLPTVIQELGGMRTGTSLMTAYQTMLGATTLKKQQVEMFNKLGMLDMAKVHKDHGHWNLDPGAIKGASMGMTNPYAWTQQILKPALEGGGYKDIGHQREVMAKLFPNRNANRMFDIFLDPASVSRIEKDRGLYGKAQGLDAAYSGFTKDNPKGVEQAFHAQYDNMMQAIGSPLMKAALPVMIQITEVFNKLGALANAHPTAIKYIGEGIAALGIALVGAGVVAIAAALGPAGWIAAGVIGLGAALMAVPWKELWSGLGSVITSVAAAISAAIASIKAAFAGGLGAGAPHPSNGMGTDGLPLITLPHTPGKQGYNAVPPAGGRTHPGSNGDIYMDGRKVGQIVSRHQSVAANGPLQGSAYHDGSGSSAPGDFNHAWG